MPKPALTPIFLSLILGGCSATPVTFATYYPDQPTRPFYSLGLHPYAYAPGTDVDALHVFPTVPGEDAIPQKDPRWASPFPKRDFARDLRARCAPDQLFEYEKAIQESEHYRERAQDFSSQGPCKDKSQLNDYQCWAYQHPGIAKCVAKIALEAEDQCTRLVGYQNHIVASFTFYTNAIGYLLAAASVGLAASNGGAAITAAAITSTSLTNTSNLQKAFPTTTSEKLADAAGNMTQSVLGAGLRDDDFQVMQSVPATSLSKNIASPGGRWWFKVPNDTGRPVYLRYALVHDRILGYCPAINP